MKKRFQPYHINDLGLGLNRFHTVDQIPEGMYSSIQNMDPKSNGQVVTRKGHEQYYGWLPLRVTQFEQDGTSIILTFDDEVDLGSVTSTPIVVAGTLSTNSADDGDNDFTNSFAAHYYGSFSVNRVDNWAAGSETKNFIASNTGLTSADAIVGFHLEDDDYNLDNTTLVPTSVGVVKASYQVDVTALGSGANYDAYTSFLDATAVAGTVHVESVSTDNTPTITAATHALNNTNLIVQCSSDDGTNLNVETPTEVTIDSSGQVDIEFTTLSPAFTGKVYLYACDTDNSVSLSSALIGTSNTSTSGTHTITGTTTGFTIDNVTTPFNIYSAWYVSGGTRTQVTPAAISYDQSAETVTVEYTPPASAEAIEFYWAPASVPANAITITDNSGNLDSFTVTDPELCVWGLGHSGNYKTTSPKGGFTHHLDNYKSDDQDFMVTAVGGNLYQATPFTTANPWKMATATLLGSNRVSGAQILAPLFTTSANSRTRGDVYDAVSVDSDGYAPVTAVAYNAMSVTYDESTDVNSNYIVMTGHDLKKGDKVSLSAAGTLDSALTEGESYYVSIISGDNIYLTAARGSIGSAINMNQDGSGTTTVTCNVSEYTFTFAGKTGSVTFDTTIGRHDRLTIRNCGYDVNNGEFQISSVYSDSSTSTVIRVENDSVTSTAFDESDINAQGNSFTGKITVTDWPVLAPGDIVVSSVTDSTNVVKDTDDLSDNDIYISGITAALTVPDGLNLFFQRTSSILPLQDFPDAFVGDDTNGGFVRGDSISITGINNTPKVVNVIPEVSTVDAGNINVSSNVATATVTNTTGLAAGQKIFIFSCDNLDLIGDFTISAVTSVSTFTFPVTTGDVSTSVFFRFVNEGIELDETLTFSTGVSPVTVEVVGRWTPVEMAKTSQERPAETKTTHFDENATTAQPYLKSVVVNDSMFLINGSDEVKKFDGSSLTNAGLVPWQAGLFLTVDSSTSALPAGAVVGWDNGSGNTPSSNTETVSGNSIDIGDFFVISAPILRVGDRFKASDSTSPTPNTEILTVSAIEEDDVNTYKVYTQEAITMNTQTGSLTLGNQYRYYVRCNMLDSNRNIVASAMLGADDLYAEVFTSSEVHIKVVGMPAFEELDHDRIEVELYRTAAGELAPFYLIERRLVDYNDDGGYMLFTDTTTDISLVTDFRADPGGDLLGTGELGNQWDAPPLANSITTVDNRLILANIKSEPTLDITFRRKDTVSALVAGDFSGKEVQFQKSTATSGSETFNDSVVFTFESSGAVSITPNTAIDATTANQITITNGTTPAAGTWVYLFHSALGETNLLDFAGWHRVTSRNVGVDFTIEMAHARSSATTTDIDSFLVATGSTFGTEERVPVWIGTDGNINQIYEDDLSLESKVAGRLAMAINATMGTDPSDNSYWTGAVLSPKPWLRARSGGSFSEGSLQVNMVDAPSGTVNVQHDITATNVETFVNNNLLAVSTDAASEIRLFNSRLAASYPNFPEIFDDPFSAFGGDGIIDVNPADGQEITAVIPFFGQSAFGAANLTQAVVVFKSNSIYLVNVASGQTQKLQSQGQGCTAPRSVSVTQDGIMFANESGVYKLGWDMKVTWVGRMLDGLWKDDLDLNDISEFCGHNYRQNRQYKLSTVTSGNDYATNVLVYDHTREVEDRPGSWTEYTNHSATGWANQTNKAYFGGQAGQVFQVRDNGDMTDFRDDASAIAAETFTTGAIHYGMPGNRKATSAVTFQYQNDATLTDVDVSTEQSLSGTFNASTQVDITSANRTVRYALADRKGTYLRVKVNKSGTKDEQLQVSRMTCHVADIGTGGVTEAAD